MYLDSSSQFIHLDQSMPEFFCSSSSNSSYPSNASDISVPWTSPSSTPECSPNRYLKFEDDFSIIDVAYEHQNNFCSTGQVPIEFEYNQSTPSSGFFNSNHELSGLDIGFGTPDSCSSGIADDFIDPSQTTFIEESFNDLHNPLHPLGVNFNTPFTPTDEHDANFVFVDSPPSANFSSFAGAKHNLTSSSRLNPLRQSLLHSPLVSSAALHRVNTRQKPRREPTESRHERKYCQDSSNYGPNIRIEKESTHKCPWQGCSGSFKRREHLKRHERTHARVDPHMCVICQKAFDRTDNLKAHTKLHNKSVIHNKTKSSRTRFDARAAGILATMAKRSKRAASIGMIDS